MAYRLGIHTHPDTDIYQSSLTFMLQVTSFSVRTKGCVLEIHRFYTIPSSLRFPPQGHGVYASCFAYPLCVLSKSFVKLHKGTYAILHKYLFRKKLRSGDH